MAIATAVFNYPMFWYALKQGYKAYRHVYGFLVKETWWPCLQNIDGLVQDCSNSDALAMELLQSCTKPSIWLSKEKTIKHITCIFHEDAGQMGVWVNGRTLDILKVL